MHNEMHKVFVSYHHSNDQWYKDELVRRAEKDKIFIDASVDTGDISDHLKDEEIRQKIRDEYLRDSTVTILLVGTETKLRKHVDWEIYSSMFDGLQNKKSGILVINLPSVDNGSFFKAHGEESIRFLSGLMDFVFWRDRADRSTLTERFPNMPSRIIDNLVSNAGISVVGWNDLTSAWRLRSLVEITFKSRVNCKYDLSTRMRRKNS